MPIGETRDEHKSDNASENIKQLALFCIRSPKEMASIEITLPRMETLEHKGVWIMYKLIYLMDSVTPHSY